MGISKSSLRLVVLLVGVTLLQSEAAQPIDPSLWPDFSGEWQFFSVRTLFDTGTGLYCSYLSEWPRTSELVCRCPLGRPHQPGWHNEHLVRLHYRSADSVDCYGQLEQ